MSNEKTTVTIAKPNIAPICLDNEAAAEAIPCAEGGTDIIIAVVLGETNIAIPNPISAITIRI